MSSRKIRRPADDAYYVAPWSENVLQGDIFKNVPLGFPAPPDAVVMAEGERRFITGPFDAGHAMLVTPSCAMAAQGEDVEHGTYAHPARTLVPLRPVEQLVEAGAIPERNLGLLHAVGSLDPLIPGAIGCIVIRPDGRRVLARAVPDPLAQRPDS